MKWLFFLLLVSCAPSNGWRVDSILTQEARFTSSRLIAKDEKPLQLELFRREGDISCFLSLSQFRFEKGPLQLHLEAGDVVFEEDVTPLKGGMRVRLSSEATDFLLRSLQEGKDVVILLNEFQKTLRGEGFETVYNQWMGSSSFLQGAIKGPLQ